MKFYDESGVEIKLCNPSKFKFVSPFQKPFLYVDIFPKKVTRPYDLVNISYEELNNLGFSIFSVPAKQRKWFKGQTVIYVIGKKNSTPSFAMKLKNCPSNIYIQKDKGGKRVRLLGLCAGYPHSYEGGGAGNWINYGE